MATATSPAVPEASPTPTTADQMDPDGTNNAATAAIPEFRGAIPTLGGFGIAMLILMIGVAGILVVRRI